jgi:hypothetical protein
LDHFFKEIGNASTLRRIVTKGALSLSRAKLDPQVFLYLIRKSQEFIDKHASLKTWRGLRLFAFDGSTAYLHQSPEIQKHFASQSNQSSEIAMARLSQCFDVLNGFTHDVQVAPYSFSERTLFSMHCTNIPPYSLFLLDRGYPSYELIHQIIEQKQNFVARLPRSFNSVVKKFVASSKSDLVCSFILPKSLKKEEYPQTIRVRLIKVELEKSTEILATSLIDSQIYPAAEFKDLYQLRWPVEEDYKKLKSTLQIENFSGKTVHSVYQDIYAKVLSKNISLALMNPLISVVEKLNQDKKNPSKMNLSYALSSLKGTLIRLLKKMNVKKVLESLSELWIQTLELVRKGRTYPRIRKFKNRYSMNNKPIR